MPRLAYREATPTPLSRGRTKTPPRPKRGDAKAAQRARVRPIVTPPGDETPKIDSGERKRG